MQESPAAHGTATICLRLTFWSAFLSTLQCYQGVTEVRGYHGDNELLLLFVLCAHLQFMYQTGSILFA